MLHWQAPPAGSCPRGSRPGLDIGKLSRQQWLMFSIRIALATVALLFLAPLAVQAAWWLSHDTAVAWSALLGVRSCEGK